MYKWPILEEDIKTSKIAETNLVLFDQMFGALSQDEENPLSRVSQANSSFSLDPSQGCPLSCSYCVAGSNKRDVYLENNKINPATVLPKTIVRLFGGEILLKALSQHPAFIPNHSVISICTGSSEPFLGTNSDDTWNIFNQMIRLHLRNPVWIVTKAGIPKNIRSVWKDRFLTIMQAKIPTIISITYSNAPTEIEPYIGNRFNPWLEFNNSGIHFSHHLRPIIRGQNDSKKSVISCLKQSLGLVESVCVGGLRLDPGILLAWKHVHKLPLSILPSKPGVKDLPKHFDNFVKECVLELGYSTPVYKRSSEVISRTLGCKDYNLYRYRPANLKSNLLLTVPINKQKEVKKKYGVTILDLINNAASRIGLSDLVNVSQDGKFFNVKDLKKLTYQTKRSLIHSIGHYQIL